MSLKFTNLRPQSNPTGANELMILHLSPIITHSTQKKLRSDLLAAFVIAVKLCYTETQLDSIIYFIGSCNMWLKDMITVRPLLWVAP